MANRTSKSASETDTASSPSGTSDEMDATGGKFGDVVKRIMKKTPEETRKSLVRAGILTESGGLTKHYKPTKKAKAKKSGPSKTGKPARG